MLRPPGDPAGVWFIVGTGLLIITLGLLALLQRSGISTVEQIVMIASLIPLPAKEVTSR